MGEKEVARVDTFFQKVGVVAITVTDGEIQLGDKLHFLGPNTDFTQVIGSMQMEHRTVELARPGDQVGIKVDEKVRRSDHVYLVTETD